MNGLKFFCESPIEYVTKTIKHPAQWLRTQKATTDNRSACCWQQLNMDGEDLEIKTHGSKAT